MPGQTGDWRGLTGRVVQGGYDLERINGRNEDGAIEIACGVVSGRAQANGLGF